MVQSRYAKGRRFEYLAKRSLEADGFLVVRSASSKGVFDLCAFGFDRVLLIQIKSTDKPNKRYLQDAKVLQKVIVPKCCEKQLWVHVARKGWTKYWIIGEDVVELESIKTK
jgi:Holliday junction resolvase